MYDEKGKLEMTYYGFIEEIWKIDYGALKVLGFHCKWVRLSAVTTDQDGIAFVDLDETAYRDEPFVLSKDVLQVFYAMDNSHEGKHVVL